MKLELWPDAETVARKGAETIAEEAHAAGKAHSPFKNDCACERMIQRFQPKEFR